MQAEFLTPLRERLTEALFPHHCALCDDPTDQRAVCPACDTDLPRYPHHCRQCAIPLPPGQERCGRCQARPPAYQRVHSPFLYQPPIDLLIKRLKFNHQLHHAALLGDLLAEHLQHGLSHTPDVIVPVPLHPKRIRERGFNQAQELARRLRRRLGIHIDNRLAIRRKHTDAQSAQKRRQRRANVASAFQVISNDLPEHILIIDDVMTTGATVNELARCFRRKGVKRIEIAVIARAETW